MRSKVFKRVLVAILLMCKVLSAQFAFEPVAVAKAAELRSGAPCAEHAHFKTSEQFTAEHAHQQTSGALGAEHAHHQASGELGAEHAHHQASGQFSAQHAQRRANEQLSVRAGDLANQPIQAHEAAHASEHDAHHESCKTGACKCPCAHTPALAVSSIIPSSKPALQSAPAFDSAPSPPGSSARFFRPPIRYAA